MFEEMESEGMNPEQSMKMKALKEMIEKIQGLLGSPEGDEGSEGEDYLDPETLGEKPAEKGGEMLAALSTDTGDGEDESMSEDADVDDSEGQSAMGGEDKLDPDELLSFFNKKSGGDRKPLKGMKLGMSEISMTPMQKGMKKRI